VVVDAGVSRVGDRVLGDVDVTSAVAVAALVVPTPGGLGPLTVVALVAHTLTAARARVATRS
jgi:methylenetetrahydrofolate dehydrogenase (NADP+)/methenyltetrahydrofolate cyclohydrolase